MSTISFSSCQKENSNVSDLNRPVVEAYLVPGIPVTVKLYYQKYLTDTITYGYAVTGMSVKISDGSKL